MCSDTLVAIQLATCKGCRSAAKTKFRRGNRPPFSQLPLQVVCCMVTNVSHVSFIFFTQGESGQLRACVPCLSRACCCRGGSGSAINHPTWRQARRISPACTPGSLFPYTCAQPRCRPRRHAPMSSLRLLRTAPSQRRSYRGPGPSPRSKKQGVLHVPPSPQNWQYYRHAPAPANATLQTPCSGLATPAVPARPSPPSLRGS